MYHRIRRIFIAILAAILPLAAHAERPVNAGFSGVAIKGYDPVAYFKQNGPIKGKSEFTFSWNGAKWQFASAENLEAFKKEPAKFAPQYGGYCAYAVSKGSTAGIDPNAWKIVKGKLYLNYDADVQKTWESDMLGYIAKADANWPKIIAR